MSTTTTTEKLTRGEQAKKLEKGISNLKYEDMIRGEKPADLEQRCLGLVQDYLGDIWLEATTADLHVERICGGFTNQLYLVRLTTPEKPASPRTPTEVTIKLFQKKHAIFAKNDVNNNSNEPEDERMSDSMISILTSQIGIAPKIYGLFADGVIQAYIKHEQFRKKHQDNPEISRQVAVHLATLHNLEVPLIKPRENPHIKSAMEKVTLSYQLHDIPALIEELGLESFKRSDMHMEVKDYCRILESAHSPMVLAHNDFRGSNILVAEEGTRAVLCDFDYSGYGPRGFDFASLFHEWGSESIGFQNTEKLPVKPLKIFIGNYMAKMETLRPGYAADPRNSVEAIIREAKIYHLANLMFFIGFMLCQTEMTSIKAFAYNEKEMMTRVDFVYGIYLDLKKSLIEDGTIDVEVKNGN